MFVVDGLELSWSVGGVKHTLRIGGDGRPQVTEGDVAAPANAAMERGRRGKAWSPTEEGEMSAAFAEGRSLPSIAAQLGRSTTAVQARLVMLGLLDSAEATLRYPVRPPVRPPQRSEPAPE